MGWDLYLTIEVPKNGVWKTVASDNDQHAPRGRCNELARALLQEGVDYDYEGDRDDARTLLTGRPQMMPTPDVLAKLGEWDSAHVLERRAHGLDGLCRYVDDVRQWIHRVHALHGHGRIVYEMD